MMPDILRMVLDILPSVLDILRLVPPAFRVVSRLRLYAQPVIRWRTSIAALPAEILARCFTFLEDHLLERLAILHVSRDWRATAFAFPSTWSVIRISDFRAYGHLLVDMVLSNTSPYPVDFRYEHSIFVRAAPEDMVLVIQNHLPRFRSIHWAADYTDGTVVLALCSEAPLLETVSGPFICIVPYDLLGGRPSRLRLLHVTFLGLPETCPALATVRHLTAAVDSSLGGIQYLHLLFDLCPELETLDLCLFTRNLGDLPRRPAPRTLRQLRLRAKGVDNNPITLRNVFATWQVIPQLEWMQLVTYSEAVTDIFFELVLDGALALSIFCTTGIFLNARHAGGAERKLCMMYKEAHELPETVIPRLVNLRELTLPSDVFELLTRTGAPLHSLTTLRIMVYPPSWFTRKRRAVFPWAHLDAFPPLPLLETLDVDVQHDSLTEPFIPALPKISDAHKLLARLDAGLSSRPGTHVAVRIHGFSQAVSSGIRTPSSDRYSISFVCT